MSALSGKGHVALWAMACLWIVCLPDDARGDEGKKDIGALSFEEAGEYCKSVQQGEDAESFTTAAFKSERMDLLGLCFETPNTAPWFLDKMQSLPESPLKRQLIVMMLKSSAASAWPAEGGGGFSGTMYILRAGIVEEALHKYRPELKVSYDTLMSRPHRLALAADLEAGEGSKGQLTTRALERLTWDFEMIAAQNVVPLYLTMCLTVMVCVAWMRVRSARRQSHGGEDRGKSHAVAWGLGIVAAPLLYLLSVAPVCSVAMRSMPSPRRVPGWLLAYSGPERWIRDCTPLGEPLKVYLEWWWRVAGPPP